MIALELVCSGAIAESPDFQMFFQEGEYTRCQRSPSLGAEKRFMATVRARSGLWLDVVILRVSSMILC